MRKLPEETIAYVIAHFKDTENIALAKEAGCSPSSVNHIQRRYNLKKSKTPASHIILTKTGSTVG